MAEKFSFEIIKTDPETGARAGVFHTPHGDIQTPVYMSVGTQATVKGVLPQAILKEAGSQIVLANTYHLYMRPGHELVKKAGGLHAFYELGQTHSDRQRRLSGVFSRKTQ